jgi:hypothetical protein
MLEIKKPADQVVFKTIHEFPLSEGHDHPFNHGFVEAYSRAHSIFKDVYFGMIKTSGTPDLDSTITDGSLNSEMLRWVRVFSAWGSDEEIIRSGVVSKYRLDYLAGQALSPKKTDEEFKVTIDDSLSLEELLLLEFNLFLRIRQINSELMEEPVTHAGINVIIDEITKQGLNAPLSYWLYWIDFCGDARVFINQATPSIHKYSNIDILFEHLE